MEHYKIDGNKDLARDPYSGSIVNVNTTDYQHYIGTRKAKKAKIPGAPITIA